MNIGREEEKNILSCVDFSRLFNVINRLPGLYIDILTNSVTFFFHIVKELFNKENILSLDKYVKLINASRHSEYINNDNFFVNTVHLKYQVI